MTQQLFTVPTYGIVTLGIIYRMPDHTDLLQEFLWQEYDVIPEIPKVRSFLAHWERHIEGPLHSVTVMYAGLIKPREILSLQSKTVLLH